MPDSYPVDALLVAILDGKLDVWDGDGRLLGEARGAWDRGGGFPDLPLLEDALQGVLAPLRLGEGQPGPLLLIAAASHRWSSMQKQMMIRCGERLGAGKVYLVDHMVAAARGAGLTLDEPEPAVLIHGGSGGFDVAVVGLPGVQAERTVPGPAGVLECEGLSGALAKAVDEVLVEAGHGAAAVVLSGLFPPGLAGPLEAALGVPVRTVEDPDAVIRRGLQAFLGRLAA